MDDTAIVWVDVNLVKPHPMNPRVGVVPAIKDAISRNGWHGALVVQRSTGFIVAGNHRWMAAQELGLAKVPVHYRDIDDSTARRILLADNRTADLASYDDPKLQQVLSMQIQEAPEPTEALAGTGYTPEAVEQLQMALSGGEAQEWGSRGSAESSADRYDSTSIRQIVWVMNDAVYERVVPIIKAMMDKYHLETVSETMLWLVERYNESLPKKEPADA